MRNFSSASENNKQAIANILCSELASAKRLMEIGSGSGQHAFHIAPQLPDILWQTSEMPANQAALEENTQQFAPSNVMAPVTVIACSRPWSLVFDGEAPDAFFTANTAHIMSWQDVECMFAEVGDRLHANGKFCLYGPVRYDGRFTTQSNQRFDHMLRTRDPASGIRDFEAFNALADKAQLTFIADHQMPANNQLLVWQKG